jgi:hypothetical protein
MAVLYVQNGSRTHGCEGEGVSAGGSTLTEGECVALAKSESVLPSTAPPGGGDREI